VCGRVTKVEHTHHLTTIENCAGNVEQLGYDVLVMAPGSIARTLPIPGLAEHGIAFKTIGEAIYLRNHVLSRLEAADTTIDMQLRRRLLSFVVIGGGYAGIEVLANSRTWLATPAGITLVLPGHRTAGDALGAGRGQRPDHARGQPGAGRYIAKRLTQRSIEVFLNTRVTTMENGHVILDDGTEFDADTIVWTAGVQANPKLTPCWPKPTCR
jgi:NADH dehydrogenase